MTKIAVISDIHANKHGFDLVLKDIEKKNVDRIICLGDSVVKNYYPAYVVDGVKENCDIVVKGNCDHLVATNENYKFARGELGIDRIDYLTNLPEKEQLKILKNSLEKYNINLFHSNPNDLEGMFNPNFKYNYLTKYKDREIKDYKNMFLDENPQITIVGHTHDNFIGVEKNNKFKLKKGLSATISDTQRAIINVGSAGEHSKMVKNKKGEFVPRIDPFLTYLIIDDSKKEGLHVEMQYVPYKDELIKVGEDMIKRQFENLIPHCPEDTKKVFDSLESMGVEKSEIYEEYKRRGL